MREARHDHRRSRPAVRPDPGREPPEEGLKIRDVYEPFSALVGLVGKYGMAEVLLSLSAIAQMAGQNVTTEDFKGLSADRFKAESEYLRSELLRLSDHTR